MTEKDCQDLADEPAKLHFDFWLNDIEGERLFSCIQHDIARGHQDILRRMMELGKDLNEETAKSDPYIMAYKGSIRALERLKGKLHNERVEEGAPDKRKAVEVQLGEDSEALFANGFEDAILGFGQQFTEPALVVYDWDKCVEILMQEGLTYEEAVEHMDYNVTGAWMGKYTPIFMRRVR